MKLCFVKASNTIYDVLFPYSNNTGLSSQRVLPINHYKAACLPPHVRSSHRRPFLSCLSLCCLRLQHSVACLFIVPVLPLECRLSEGVLPCSRFYLWGPNSTGTQKLPECLKNEWMNCIKYTPVPRDFAFPKHLLSVFVNCISRVPSCT